MDHSPDTVAAGSTTRGDAAAGEIGMPSAPCDARARSSPVAPFDPSAPVPEAYDVFCESCGYSLLGLSTDRCPECGMPYDPLALPYARVPWLHRRRVGRWSAYWQTVRQVVFRPRAFAAELCRPVRISADDARRFRQISVHLGAATAVAVAAALMYLFGDFPQPRSMTRSLALILEAGVLLIGWIAAVTFLKLATDMPLFIWQGLPSMPATELAPLHHYASAPLALLPWVAPVVVVPFVLTSIGGAPFDFTFPLIVTTAAAGLWLLMLWRTPLVLMKTATGCGRGRVLVLGLYLPVHYVLMALVVFLVTVVSVLVVGGLLNRL